MEAKLKAEEIWLCYYELIDDIYSNEAAKELAKKYSLIAVDEIYNEIDDNYDTLHSSDRKQYWQEVKQEIEKL
jgi:hypothetical protein